MYNIFLDVDGIVADFHGHIAARLGCSHIKKGVWSLQEGWGVSDADVQAAVDDIMFWETLPKTHDADEIIKIVEGSGHSVVFLTSPHVFKRIADFKLQWIERHFPDREVIIARHKYRISTWKNLLIDDADHNIDLWRREGGMGILYPRPWNSQHTIEDGLGWFKRTFNNTLGMMR